MSESRWQTGIEGCFGFFDPAHFFYSGNSAQQYPDCGCRKYQLYGGETENRMGVGPVLIFPYMVMDGGTDIF